MTIKPSDDVSVEQASAALQVSTVSIRKWCRLLRIRGARMVGREWRIPRETVLEIQRDGTPKSAVG